LTSRIAVAVSILGAFAICRQLRPWSLSRRTSTLLNSHFGRPALLARGLSYEIIDLAGRMYEFQAVRYQKARSERCSPVF
jgi:hypothetical protein